MTRKKEEVDLLERAEDLLYFGTDKCKFSAVHECIRAMSEVE